MHDGGVHEWRAWKRPDLLIFTGGGVIWLGLT